MVRNGCNCFWGKGAANVVAGMGICLELVQEKDLARKQKSDAYGTLISKTMQYSYFAL